MTLAMFFLAGCIVGYILAFVISSRSKAFRELKEQLASKEAEIFSYQNQVSEHFQKTADLFSELQVKQDNLVSHLQDGAKRLRCDMLDAHPFIALQGKPTDAPKDYPIDKKV